MAILDDPQRLNRLDPAITRLDADAILDACVEEAARLAEAPIALVSLVMRHVQLFRAHRGLPPELALSCATSRRNSFCQFVVRDERPLVVEDTTIDSWVPQDLVERYGIRAYAGVPVRVDGQPIGTLCVIDITPRRFSPAVMNALEVLGTRVAARLSELVGDEPAEGPPAAPQERLRLLRRMARLLEGALQALGPPLEQARAAELSDTPTLDPAIRSDLSAAVLCYEDLAVAARELSTEATRLSRGAPDPRVETLLMEARSLTRELDEAGPMVRLAQGALSDRVGLEAAAKAVSVTRQALDFHANALAAAQRLLKAADAVDAAWTEVLTPAGEVAP
ncbi:diguanylate cyclase [Chondromyces crocatus]|uniref:Diguanylate cyclase n=2 Tax=Chondromyces crocatus TaxID=52 RepID=A0A0K1EH37_CHOCO|nr:diguanylate cyclase [Chondromyces crocatus]